MRAEWRALAGAALLAACGTEPATGRVTAVDALADVDAHTADAVADTQTDAADAAAPEAAVTDVPDALASLWFAGTWRSCGGTWVVAADGAWTYTDANSGCTVAGTATWDGATATADLAAEASACKAPNWMTSDVGLALQGDVLSALAPGLQGARRLARGPVDRQRWRLTDNNGWQYDLDLCSTAAGQFYGGRWSALKECGFLACGGIVDDKQVVGTDAQYWTHCTGPCACAGLLIAKTQTATAMTGMYTSANCQTGHAGTFTAVRMPFPGD